MNHLCGLPDLHNHDDGPSSSTSVDEDERAALAELRKRYRYESALLRETGGGGDDDGGGIEAEGKEEKEGTAASPSPPSSGDPTYEVSPDDLPESGLRPLDDVTLRRFLLADRGQGGGAFDVEASHARLIAALRFRKEWRCDAIVNNLSSGAVPAHVRKCRRLRVAIWAGSDREQRPVVFERLGQFFSSGNVAKCSQEEWMESYLYFLESHFAEMRESARRSGRAVDRIVYFADFRGVVSSIFNRGIWRVVPLLKALVKKVECHYPELVDHIVLFNVPRVASAAYNAVRGFLDPVTAEKIELFPGVPLGRFKELVPEDVVPEEYGGKNRMEYPQTTTE